MLIFELWYYEEAGGTVTFVKIHYVAPRNVLAVTLKKYTVASMHQCNSV